MGKVEFYKSKDGWRWRVWSNNGNILADSGQGYTRKCDCKRGAVAAGKVLWLLG